MTVCDYDPGMDGVLTALYNSLVGGLPQCYEVGEDRLSQALRGAAGGQASHERLRDEQALVAHEQGECVGFIHTAVEAAEAGGAARGVIRALWYRPGSRAAGEALLSVAHQAMAGRGLARAIAFHNDYRYPFYHIGHAYLSDRLVHIHALLGYSGYQRIAGEVYLDWPNYPAPDLVGHPQALDIRLEWGPERAGRPGLRVLASRGDASVGECVCIGATELTGDQGRGDWVLTMWLGVEQDAQGAGLGRFLLQTALAELRKAGYRHALISTSWTNHRAQLFYSNMGYRVCDWTYALEGPVGS